MRTLAGIPALTLTFVLGFSLPGQAADCTPELQLAVDAEIGEGGQIFIPLTVNDRTVQALFCTGCAWSSLGERFVDAAGIPKLKGRLRFVDATGTEPTYYVRASSVKLGNVAFTGKAEFLVDEGDDGAMIGLNLMSNFDVEIDIGARRVSFYRPSACARPGLAWMQSAVEIPFHTKDGGPKGVIDVKGRKLQALISTSTIRTSMSLAIARHQFDWELAPNATPSGYLTFLGGQRVATYDTTLPVLTLSGLRFTDVPVSLVDLDSYGIEIGMHELSQLRLYFAFGRKRLYAAPR